MLSEVILVCFVGLILQEIHANPCNSSLLDDASVFKAAIIFRHGDRAIHRRYPTDPNIGNIDKDWPNGLLRLTDAGRQRMLRVGQLIRKRYPELVPHKQKEISILSSAADRCLESAKLVTKGMNPDVILNITVPHNDFLGYDIFNCDGWFTTTEMQYTDPQVEQFFLLNKQFLNEISRLSGDNFGDKAEFVKFYDIVRIEQENNKTIPDWLTTERMEKLKYINGKVFCINTSSTLMQEMESGRIYDDLRRLNDGQKMLLYSTHDRVIMSFMKLLTNSTAIKAPSYGAALFIEFLRSDNLNEDYVRALYLDDVYSKQPQQLVLAGCECHCSLSRFKDMIAELSTSQAEHEVLCSATVNGSTHTECFDKVM